MGLWALLLVAIGCGFWWMGWASRRAWGQQLFQEGIRPDHCVVCNACLVRVEANQCPGCGVPLAEPHSVQRAPAPSPAASTVTR
jgi:hypothetical protein